MTAEASSIEPIDAASVEWPRPPEYAQTPDVVAAEKDALKTHISKGEKLFNWITYAGVAGLGTFLATIPVTYWIKYKDGSKTLEKGTDFLIHQGMSRAAATDAMMTTATMQGGNLTIIPVKIMENYKPAIVEKFNDMLGDKSGDASIDNEPRQSWGSLIKSRLTAWVPVFAGFRGTAMLLGNDKLQKFEKKFAENIFCKPFGQPTHIEGLAKIEKNETAIFRYGRMAALDIFATTAATTILFAASRMFAKNNPVWKARDLPPQNPLAAVSAPEYDQAGNAEPAKRFTDSVTPQANGNFAENVAMQKKSQETSNSVNI